MRFYIIAAVAASLITSTAALPLFISEVAPWSSSSSPFGSDWFEVTNGGTTPVDITGWKFDDNSNSFAAAVPLAGITTIAPGESVIFVDTADAAVGVKGFVHDWFNGVAPKGLQIGTYSGSGVGLTTTSDAVNLFNTAGVITASVTFGASTGTPTLRTFDNSAGLDNAAITAFSTVGVNGAFNSANPIPGFTETGSPGTIGKSTTPPTPVKAPTPLPTKGAIPNRPIAPTVPTKPSPPPNVNTNGLNFFIFGDWGHNVPASQSESGIDYEQAKIAKQIGIFAGKIKPSFFAVLGDNFYGAGPVSTTDPIWDAYYRSIYTESATYVPWYPIFGNHDYYIGKSVQAQIDYYYERRDSRWTFPDYQYTRKWPIPGTSKTLEIVFINTVALCPEVSQSNIGWPKDSRAITLIWQPVAQWINNTLAASTADYLIVAGHYNVYTNGDSNNGIGSVEYNCGIKRLVPLLKQHGVAAYIHGHKHNFQHHFIDGMHYIDVGHGSDKEGKLLGGSPPGLLFNRTVGGFAHARAGKSGIRFYFIDESGAYIHNFTVTNPPHRRHLAKLAASRV